MLKKVPRKCEGKSAGAIIRRNGKILLMDRAFFPFGWACPAGHIKVNEKSAGGMKREVREETGLIALKPKIVLNRKHVPNKCVKGGKFHDWQVFECGYRGRVKRNNEAKNMGWFSAPEIKKLKLEPIWRKWFKELKII